MKTWTILIALVLVGCATTTPPIPQIEYTGISLKVSKDYSISKLPSGSTIFTFVAPEGEKILINLYEPDGKLGITIYSGEGHIMAVILAKVLDKYDYRLKKGSNKLILFGENGKAEFNLTVQ